MKQIIFLLLAAAAVTAGAQTFKAGDLWYAVTAAGQVAVAPTHDATYQGVQIIPEQVYYDGQTYRVTSIADQAFYQSAVTEVQVPASVTRIGTSAFAFSQSLASITLPLHLQAVSQTLLEGTGIVNVAVPEGITTLGYGAFQSCGQLHTALLPSTLKSIDAYGFNNCHNLMEIYCAAPKPPTATAWAIFIGLSGIDVVVPDQAAADLYGTDPVWGNDSTFTLYPDEDPSVTMSNELERYNDSYMRLTLGNNLAYRIYAGDSLVALTAADHYYLPILDHPVTYTVVPTTMMHDADAVSVTVAPSAVRQLPADLVDDQPQIYAHDGVIHITGDNTGRWVRVFDTIGRLQFSSPAMSGEVTGLDRNRVYIVVVGRTVKKVFL